MTIDWAATAAIATIIALAAGVVSVALIFAQLRRQAEAQFIAGTQSIFELWEDDDFQRAVQWILYELSEQTWRAFVSVHGGKYGERAFIRAGGYYDRIGYLVAHRLLGRDDRLLLDTVAGSAIAVWQKIEPLVLEARLIENATMFNDYQRMLPRCYECYRPNQPVPAEIQEGAEEAERVSGD